MLNYSIIENSLNIKLECLSKQSLEYKDLISNTLKEQKTTQVDKKQSIAKLHALLENQNLECIHGGKVILKSNKGKSFKSDGIPIMLESDLLNSSIVACPNTIAGVSVPCTKVVNVKGSLSQKKVNNEYVILQELISACKTDKGFALKVSFTPTKFKFDHSFDPEEGLGEQSKNQIELKEPIIRLHYKSDRFQKDNLPIYNLLINNEKKEQNKALNEFNIDLKDLKDIEDINILNQFKQDFSKDYEFKELNLSFDTNLIKLYFIIPKNIAKVYKSAYKEFENKDLGVGYFTQLHEYDKIIKNSLEDNKELNEYHFSFLAPAKMQKIDFEIAKGLDEWLDNENVCCFNVYIKDYFNANNKDMLISDNIKDDTNTTQAHTNENYNNTQEIIPDNVIRIQTQDGSGEFIEIIFDELKEWEKSSSGAIKPLFIPLEGIVEDISNSLENVSIIGDALAMLGAVKNPKNAKNIIKKKSKYATKQEAIDVLKNKYNLKTSKELNKMGYKQFIENNNVYIAKDNKQIKEIWDEITKDATILPDKGNGIKMRKLDDQTIIQYKKASKSGGETIEINSNKPRGNLRTIHIENGVKNEV
ncbi:hypothetical protein NVT61_001830 [Campylobacter coli]|nr:hypothetical protein [Campylobacter coli]EJT2991790.1 hypothetical protein [Campylobacter coli]